MNDMVTHFEFPQILVLCRETFLYMIRYIIPQREAGWGGLHHSFKQTGERSRWTSVCSRASTRSHVIISRYDTLFVTKILSCLLWLQFPRSPQNSHLEVAVILNLTLRITHAPGRRTIRDAKIRSGHCIGTVSFETRNCKYQSVWPKQNSVNSTLKIWVSSFPKREY